MMKEVLICLCLTLAPVWTVPVQTDSGPVVVLKHGSVRGQYMKAKGSEKVVEQYLGIPFAQPPVGPLRLAAPGPVQGWEGIRNATQHPSISESDKLPVMVWIHGGALVMGGACTFDGSSLAAYENIVVVVIQYRLGILGYFSTGDKNSQGNWGFLDQIAALQWVQQNIEVFGGDPQSVTIAGQSAGGISASFLTLSPMTKGLFQRAVFQSGVATVMSYSVKDPLMLAKVVANVTECDFSSNEVLTKCIKELTEEQIVNASKKKHIFPGAIVDGEFLKAQPEELLKSKDFHKVPILVGTTNHEFGWMLSQASLSLKRLGKRDGRKNSETIGGHFYQRWSKTLLLFFLSRSFLASRVNEIIVEEYLKNAKTPEDIRDAFTEMMGDIFMVIPSITVASYHRDAGVPVYMYEFQQRPSIFKDLRPSFVKADHGDDLGFVFGACFWDGHIKVEALTEEENQLCRTVMGYWANFIRTGSPNGPSLVHWPVYDKTNKYMNLGLQQTEGQDLKMDKLLFFAEELPKKLAALQKP
ncbi:hypothetical protein cypCar_00043232 [Cyprinus carpio]|nr:hypothetical protein cypCar_00043232 [Cyprinus carpio]